MKSSKSINIAFLSTYPPRDCRIAAFTQELLLQMSYSHATRQSRVIAVSSDPLRYDNNVMMELVQNDRSSYAQTACILNSSDIDLLVIEHAFGIYGGESGEYLLDLVNNLQIPFVTTLHTIPPEPNKMERYIVKTLGQKGKKIMTMAWNTVGTLQSVYGIAPSKIEVINHGVPFIHMKPRQKLKMDSGWENRFIVSTFGPFGPGKGLEYGIHAIAKVAQTHKEVLYFILGQTNAATLKESGENYRDTLEALVQKLGIEDNVLFVDKYMTKGEIVHYLTLSDVYLTPNLDKNQTVSADLAYAVGYGRIAVSTPYSYAKELLAEGRGLLADFKDSEAIATCITYVIDNPNVKKKMELRALEIGKYMMWDNIGAEYKRLFLDVYLKYGNITVTDGVMTVSDRRTAATA